jgi:hypothetical protein
MSSHWPVSFLNGTGFAVWYSGRLIVPLIPTVCLACRSAQVHCLYFVARGTLDDILWKLLEKKFRDLGKA